MKKLTLNLDELSVQSFVATPETGPRRGTVIAHYFTEHYGITCAAPSICSGGDDSEGCPSNPCANTEYPECEMME